MNESLQSARIYYSDNLRAWQPLKRSLFIKGVINYLELNAPLNQSRIIILKYYVLYMR